MKFFKIFVLVFVLFLLPTSVRAATINVSSGQSINNVISASTTVDGDTISVSGNHSTEKINVTKKLNIICVSNPCIIQGVTISANESLVQGFYILPTGNDNSGGISINGNSNIVKNNIIEGACMAGIVMSGSNNLAEGNDISKSRQCSGTSGPDADGIRIFSNGNVARGNYIHDITVNATTNPTAHSDCFQSWGNITNAIIENNICDGLSHAGVQTDGGLNDVVRNITIRGNVIRANRGLNMWGETITISNNVFIGNSISGSPSTYVLIRESDDGSKISTNVTFTNNIIHNTSHGIIVVGNAVIQGGNNIFWNDSGVAPQRDSGYSGTPSSLKWPSDKWQTINPNLTSNYQVSGYACSGGVDGTYIGAYPCNGSVSPTQNPTPIFNIADLEPDGDVDGNDFLTLVSNFGLTGALGWIRSDIIKNGVVDIFDINKLITNFGQ